MYSLTIDYRQPVADFFNREKQPAYGSVRTVYPAVAQIFQEVAVNVKFRLMQSQQTSDLVISSSAFTHGKMIPQKHPCNVQWIFCPVLSKSIPPPLLLRPDDIYDFQSAASPI